MTVDTNFQQMLAGYGQTTMEITYRLPDHPSLVQEFIWQLMDMHPHFPEVNRFCAWWQKTLVIAPITRVRIAHSKLIKPAEIAMVDGQFRLNQNEVNL